MTVPVITVWAVVEPEIESLSADLVDLADDELGVRHLSRGHISDVVEHNTKPHRL
jgi:hypothetical protein